VLNAANEVAVESFLEGRLSFTRIPAVIEHALSCVDWRDIATLNDVLEADAAGRDAARHLAASLPPRQ
jgi:1-deoxy-D-xylulose-5-phosphate reductoisomerase